ncbi:hypothetical protein PACTADRAFT_33883 [Pachysolen tannophilus NRRL Y-2460]|uniref:K Homology domain-containing protein n=1 Tax=Pachysolen tannophilus NRRL Y-2460 TaxID=669874 RepID=A0A1E4TUB4_PACTA|nr:hypothetical protein PACTADRAFT_33883 [Pachysolen tannophilus NRRL Y-2460]
MLLGIQSRTGRLCDLRRSLVPTFKGYLGSCSVSTTTNQKCQTSEDVSIKVNPDRQTKTLKLLVPKRLTKMLQTEDFMDPFVANRSPLKYQTHIPSDVLPNMILTIHGTKPMILRFCQTLLHIFRFQPILKEGKNLNNLNNRRTPKVEKLQFLIPNDFAKDTLGIFTESAQQKFNLEHKTFIRLASPYYQQNRIFKVMRKDLGSFVNLILTGTNKEICYAEELDYFIFKDEELIKERIVSFSEKQIRKVRGNRGKELKRISEDTNCSITANESLTELKIVAPSEKAMRYAKNLISSEAGEYGTPKDREAIKIRVIIPSRYLTILFNKKVLNYLNKNYVFVFLTKEFKGEKLPFSLIDIKAHLGHMNKILFAIKNILNCKPIDENDHEVNKITLDPAINPSDVKFQILLPIKFVEKYLHISTKDDFNNFCIRKNLKDSNFLHVPNCQEYLFQIHPGDCTVFLKEVFGKLRETNSSIRLFSDYSTKDQRNSEDKLPYQKYKADESNLTTSYIKNITESQKVRLLGPKGNTLKSVCDNTNCRIDIKPAENTTTKYDVILTADYWDNISLAEQIIHSIIKQQQTA